ncbi:hypothetical protein B566_EDAN015429 [Ephemera danica]|nr:hypothetical protein B566_EDAN015429 [Ephemera danica]
MGFEPTRAKHIGLAIQCLNLSATSSPGNPVKTAEQESGLAHWALVPEPSFDMLDRCGPEHCNSGTQHAYTNSERIFAERFEAVTWDAVCTQGLSAEAAKQDVAHLHGSGPSEIHRTSAVSTEAHHVSQGNQQVQSQTDHAPCSSCGGPSAHIHIKESAVPVFCKPRPVPFALKDLVAKQLDDMIKSKIIEPVKFSEWATPTVNLLKKDGTIRVCDEILTKLNGGKCFAKLDLSQAFLQVPVDTETADRLTLTTHKGLFRVLRLCAGLSSAPAIFQQIAENLVAGLDVHRPGKDNGNADYLSRMPVPVLPDDKEEYPAPSAVLQMLTGAPAGSLLSAERVAAETKADPVLSVVMSKVLHGRLYTTDLSVQAYMSSAQQLSVQGGCVLHGDRVVLPASLRNEALRLLHQVHQGVVRTKGLARCYFWWPGMSIDIEKFVSSCDVCMQSRNTPAKAPVMTWPTPKAPWSRLHLDFAGPIHGFTFLIGVDAYSKWVECDDTNGSMTSATVIKCCRKWFATHGLPDEMVCDNAACFKSEEMYNYCASNGIKQSFSAPFHPATNGQAERVVQTVKNLLLKFDSKTWKSELPNILLMLHVTPNPVTGKSPAELLMGRCPRTLLDRAHPGSGVPSASDVTQAGGRTLEEGQIVMYRNYSSGPQWLQGTISKVCGARHYLVTTHSGLLIKRHIDQLIQRKFLQKEAKPTTITPKPILPYPQQEIIPSDHASRNSTPNKSPLFDSEPNIPECIVNEPGPAPQLEVDQEIVSEEGPAPPSVPLVKLPGEAVVSRPVRSPARARRPESPVPRRVSQRVKQKPVYFKDYIIKH